MILNVGHNEHSAVNVDDDYDNIVAAVVDDNG